MDDQTTATVSPDVSIEVPYDEPKLGAPDVDVRLENIWGTFPRVTAIPTWTPKSFREGFAIDTTNNIFYFYDFVDNAWIAGGTTSLTANQLAAITGANSPSASNVFATKADLTNIFGNGADGAAALDGSNTYSYLTKSSNIYTMQRDTYFTDLTISTGVTLQTAGYILFVNGTLTRAGTGVITNNGGSGGDGGDGGDGSNTVGGVHTAAGTAGPAAGSGTLPEPPAGKVGGVGGDGSTGGSPQNGTSATAGISVTNALGNNGALGGDSGAGGNADGSGGSSASGGAAGTVTLNTSKPNDIFSLRNLAVWVAGVWTRYAVSAGSGSGAGGGGGDGNGTNGSGAGGSGGGSGAAGGVIVAFIRAIVAANTNTLFQAVGGNGGKGGKGGSATFSNPGFEAAGGGGAGGGGAGSGGLVGLVYRTCDQTVSSIISVLAGTAGVKGVKGSPSGAGPSAAGDGTNGGTANAGVSFVIQV